MKIKKLLMVLTLAGLAASCTNDDVVVVKPETEGPFDLQVKVNVNSLTRSTGQAVNKDDVSAIN